MKINAVKFEVPGMGEQAESLYEKLYGEQDGSRFMSILATSPDEIAVISRLLAFLHQRRGEVA